MNLESVIEQLITQAPLAGTAVYVARMYMQKHETAIQKLIATFEGEVKACEARYGIVFAELMKLKDKLK